MSGDGVFQERVERTEKMLKGLLRDSAQKYDADQVTAAAETLAEAIYDDKAEIVVQAGSHIIHEGDKGHSMYFIEDGQVKACRKATAPKIVYNAHSFHTTGTLEGWNNKHGKLCFSAENVWRRTFSV